MKLPGGFGAIKTTFANRNYRLYVIGNLSSTTGLWIQRVAIGWLTWDLTHSAAWLGGIVIAESIPTLLLGLLGGALVDRMSYVKLLRITQALSLAYSIMLAVATFTGLMNIWLLLGLTIFRGCVISFSRPSRMTFMFSLVGRELLASALATNSMIFNISRFIGPALGGIIIAAGGAYGVASAFTAASGLLFIMTSMLGLMRFGAVPPREDRHGTSMLSETIAGLRYVMVQPTIRIQLLLLIGTSLFAKPVIDLLPGFAASVFDQGAHGLGLLLSFHGFGATLGGVWLASRSNGMTGLTHITILNILFISLALFLFTATDIFWFGCITSSVLGFAFIIMSVGNQTLIQAAVDPDLRGRVVAVYGMIAQDVPALGAMLMGGFAEHFGLQLPVAAGAGICLILWLWGRRQQGWMSAALETQTPSKDAPHPSWKHGALSQSRPTRPRPMTIRLPGGLTTLRRLLVNRNYGFYVFGHWIGNIGLWIQRVAIGWLTWELSESSGWLGAIAFADQAPAIVIGIFAGAVVDRVDYLKMLRLTQALTLIHSALLAFLTLTGAMDIWLLFALTLVRGVITAFNRPSRMTVVYALVGRDLLPSALAFNSMIFNSSRFIGPALGGGIMAGASTGWAFVAAAVSILIFSLALAVIRIGAMPERERKGKSLFTEAIEGVRYAVSHAGISLQLWILVLASLFARPVTDLLPGFTAAIFSRGPDGLALFLTFHGIGATAGGLWLTSRSSGVKGMTNVMIFSLLLMASSLLIFSQLTAFWVGCLLVTVIGASFSMQGISNQTLIQYAVDPAYRGRVGSVYGAIARGGPAVGALIMGVAGDHLGLRIPVAAGAILCLMLVLWSWRRRAIMAAALEGEPGHAQTRAARDGE